jgi:hypothetical protein
VDPGPSLRSSSPVRTVGSHLPFLRATAVGWRASRLTTLVAYGVVVLAFAVALIAIEVSVGDPLVPARSPGASHSFEDACWHLGTGLALALPARRWTAAWMGAIMTLGLDTDHVFGDVLPTVLGRTDHCVVFLAGAAMVLYLLQGRTSGLLAAGAITAHISLDGGSFALLAPVSTTEYAFPLWATAVGVFAAALCFYLAFRPARGLRRPLDLSIIVVIGLVSVLAFLIFTSSATFLFN